MALVLASKSPRRRQLMELVTADFVVDEADVDEEEVTAAGPEELVLELARQKAAAVSARRPGDVVIGSDTVVAAEGRILGKPKSPGQAAEMMRLLSGKSHRVCTGLVLLAPAMDDLADGFCEVTTMWMGDIPEEEIAAYVATDEPYDKAGGYGIQGWAARFVERIDGCYYNVMGLPVAHLYKRLHELHILKR